MSILHFNRISSKILQEKIKNISAILLFPQQRTVYSPETCKRFQYNGSVASNIFMGCNHSSCVLDIS
ncbi:hypothetical protein HMPREF0322_00613 [Desulfitobacterium hafniense DP7]|uniref:Uncharacterized protein n=1 Tax=Desulfitobacterium hafniense DP7 TaxID=537010 RepID=G9XI37_DESHA|nr:hypothetical protein HMPREF0322_00613 [Desulfitobacterium hafniense DP7]